MNNIQIIKRDEEGEEIKNFENVSAYERLLKGDIVEVESKDGKFRDYLVVSGNWVFSHFGNTLSIIIEPLKWRDD